MNINAISLCAWQGFLKKGRGVVFVLVDKYNQATEKVPFYFLPEAKKLMVKDLHKHRASHLPASREDYVAAPTAVSKPKSGSGTEGASKMAFLGRSAGAKTLIPSNSVVGRNAEANAKVSVPK